MQGTTDKRTTRLNNQIKHIIQPIIWERNLVNIGKIKKKWYDKWLKVTDSLGETRQTNNIKFIMFATYYVKGY